MTTSGIISVFIIASTKFLFAPFTAILYHEFTFWEAIFVCSIGGIFGVTLFYFLGELIFGFFANIRKRNDDKKRASGQIVMRKKFTPFNRKVIRIKHRFGLYGFGFLTPCILSIPIGSVITARFYHHRSAFRVLTVLYFWVIVWAFILTIFNDFLAQFLI